MRSKIKASDDKNILGLFQMSKNFEVPDYQREYVWGADDEVAEMFDDLTSFKDHIDSEEDNYYFGSVVFQKENEKLLVVDGQQRMTTFVLVLRAFLEVLQKTPEADLPDEAFDLKKEMSDALLNTTKGEYDYSKPRFHSNSYSDKNKEDFLLIIQHGSEAKTLLQSEKTNYWRNYQYIVDRVKQYIWDFATSWLELPRVFIEKVQLVVLECDNFETAINVFKTLNSTGQKLSDMDIIKVKLMDELKDNNKALSEFVERWNDIIETVVSSKIKSTKQSTAQDKLINALMHYHKASEGNSDQTDIRPLEYFNKKRWLYSDVSRSLELLDDILYFYRVIYADIDISCGQDKRFSGRTLSLLWTLFYLNDGWERAPIVYYLRHKDNEEFASLFETFLERYLKAIYYEWLKSPSSSGIKQIVYKTYVEVYEKASDIKAIDINYDVNTLKSNIPFYDNDKVKKQDTVLALITSIEQGFNIPIKTSFEVEHILPKKFEASYSGIWEKDGHREYLERLGNKLPLLKRTNIQIGNSWEGAKWEKYEESDFKIVSSFVDRFQNRIWTKETIEENTRYYENLIANYYVGEDIF